MSNVMTSVRTSWSDVLAASVYRAVRRGWRIGCLLLVVGGLAAGCSDGSNGGTSTDTGIVDGGDEADGETTDISEGDTFSCQPGEILRCSEPNTQSIIQCNAAGDGETPGSCPPKSVCREGECVDVTCVPGRGRCNGDGLPQRCNQEGTQWVDQESCSEGESCESGACLNRCEQAANSNSYIGCEYWAVELENHLLFDERETGDPIPENMLPPFAIVLANTSSQYNATVSVYESPGQPATALGSRRVGTDIRTPDVFPKTVESELLDLNGDVIRQVSGPVDELELPSQSMMVLLLDSRQIPNYETSVTQKAYEVESSQPVVAYQFNPYCCNYNYTNDASLLLPKSALTGNYMYMSQPVWVNPGSDAENPEAANLTVLPTENDTEVTINFGEPTDPTGQPISYSEALYAVKNNGSVNLPNSDGQMEVTLDAHQALNVAAKAKGVDLTGARVEANKPVSVFGNHSCTFVPFATPACDHLEQQLLPMETWGETYNVVPVKVRGTDEQYTREGTYWKFLAREDDTEIETGLNLNVSAREDVLGVAGEGEQHCSEFAGSETNRTNGTFTLDAGESCEFGTKVPFEANATKPIMIGGTISSEDTIPDQANQVGDPGFFIVPPRQQFRDDYSFLTPQTYRSDYVTVITPRASTEIILDGETIDVADHPTFESYPDLGFGRAHLEVEPGPHRIRSSSVQFGILTYGFHDYVSYAYTGGLDLAKYNPVD
jgi:hypothetical protein